jgi:hypothetical protein
MKRLALSQEPVRFRHRYFSCAWSGADDPLRAGPSVPIPPKGSDLGPGRLSDPASPLTEHRATSCSGSLHTIQIP